MSSPPEINDRDEQNRLTLWLILDGLYGLKQSGNLLYLRVIDSLTAKGFVKLISDPSAYTRYNGEHMELLLVYVDDLFFMSPSPMSRDQFKVDLQTDFKLNENKSQSSHKFSAETPSILNIGMIRDWENDTLIVHHANFIEHMAKKNQSG